MPVVLERHPRVSSRAPGTSGGHLAEGWRGEICDGEVVPQPGGDEGERDSGPEDERDSGPQDRDGDLGERGPAGRGRFQLAPGTCWPLRSLRRCG